MTSAETAPIAVAIESGSTFELYKGPQCLQRLDWTRAGTEAAMRMTHVGHMEAWCADRIIVRWNALLRLGVKRITNCHDCWEATGYESGFRIKNVAWSKEHPGVHAGIHFLTRSKLLNMGFTVVSLALPGLVNSYGKRQDFDLLMKKLGLPVTVVMPEFKPGT
jgi:hypothetical protein